MSYELKFRTTFDYKEKKPITKDDCKSFASIVVDQLSENCTLYEDAHAEDIIENFGDYLHLGYSRDYESVMFSDNYFDLSIFIQFAKWLIREGFTVDNKVTVLFQWDGEETGDYTEKEITVYKIGNKFKGTTIKMIPQVVPFDLNSNISQC